MLPVLSNRDWNEIWEADGSKVETVCQPEPFEVCSTWKGTLGEGYSRRMELRDLWLNIEEYQMTSDVKTTSEVSSWGPVSSFFVAGTAKNRHLGLTDENVEKPGHNYLEGIHAGVEVDYSFANEPVVRVRLGLLPHALKQFGQNSPLPPDLESWMSGEPPVSFYRQGVTTPEMQVILQQILQCPYRGAIKQMYLEGKVLELMALQFTQFAAAHSAVPDQVPLKANEIECLHHAREILMQQFERPPSILALARQVGLNDCKLKQGFRQMFGTTVFGYLREYRLEQARLLLADGQLNVQEVARAIGYTHAGHFASAFKRKFGVNPKAYQARSSC